LGIKKNWVSGREEVLVLRGLGKKKKKENTKGGGGKEKNGMSTAWKRYLHGGGGKLKKKLKISDATSTEERGSYRLVEKNTRPEEGSQGAGERT